MEKIEETKPDSRSPTQSPLPSPSPNSSPSLSGPANQLYEDMLLVAFFKLKGHGIIPHICRDDPGNVSVAFEVLGDEGKKEESIRDFYDNVQVGVQEYVWCYREIKSQMCNLRKLKRNQ
jgi:hypothetical protein